MIIDSKQIGNAISCLRRQKQLSQEVLSGFAGIARTHLSMIENGTKYPNLDTLCKLASAFELKPSELLKYIEEYSE